MQPMILPLPPNRVRRNYRGGQQFDELEGMLSPGDGDQPEDWTASTVPARNPGLPAVANEGLAHVLLRGGKPILLRDLLSDFPEHYLGAAHFERLGAELGFLVKLLDSSMRLHVQAHPTAEFARRHLNSRWGKLETYVILAVRPGCEGYIRLGFQRSPGPAEWRRIILEQDIKAMDACFDRIPVRPGEVWVVPGGMPHAIGEGLLVLETMEPTDLVVRCEFEREGIVVPPEARFMGRDPDFALRIFEHESLSAEQVRARCRVRPMPALSGPGFLEEELIGAAQTDCFAISRLVTSGYVGLSAPGTVQVGIVWNGAGTIGVPRQRLTVHRGSRFLVAAAAREVEYEPAPGEELEILLCRPGQPTGSEPTEEAR